jgi:23S rRNA (cytosine1962-C5)-methyltransferase
MSGGLMKAILKEGKEKSLLRRHPWIFSGAIGSLPQISPGEILPVYSASGQFLAQAYFHPKNSLSGRVLSFTEEPIERVLKKRLEEALAMRRNLLDPSITNAFRWINAEGDGISGLIVDVYADTLVMQISTWGIERLKPFFVRTLVELFKPKALYEKSSSSSRNQEGLPEREELVWGEKRDEIEILENGVKFLISIEKGQKTGFFLDQREMRKQIGSLAHSKNVLNCFSYSGGFSLAALKGGAHHVTSIDTCETATRLAEQNTQLNGFTSQQHRIVQEDVFRFLEKDPLNYNLIILDPPAFAKKREDNDQACKGYKEINRRVLEKCPPQSLLLTCSCSYFIDEELFQNLIFQSALEAGRNVKIIGRHLLAQDHPILIYHREGSYLKSLLLYVD